MLLIYNVIIMLTTIFFLYSCKFSHLSNMPLWYLPDYLPDILTW